MPTRTRFVGPFSCAATNLLLSCVRASAHNTQHTTHNADLDVRAYVHSSALAHIGGSIGWHLNLPSKPSLGSPTKPVARVSKPSLKPGAKMKLKLGMKTTTLTGTDIALAFVKTLADKDDVLIENSNSNAPITLSEVSLLWPCLHPHPHPPLSCLSLSIYIYILCCVWRLLPCSAFLLPPISLPPPTCPRFILRPVKLFKHLNTCNHVSSAEG